MLLRFTQLTQPTCLYMKETLSFFAASKSGGHKTPVYYEDDPLALILLPHGGCSRTATASPSPVQLQLQLRLNKHHICIEQLLC